MRNYDCISSLLTFGCSKIMTKISKSSTIPMDNCQTVIGVSNANKDIKHSKTQQLDATSEKEKPVIKLVH